MNDTWIHLRRIGDRIEVTGTPSCTLGNPLDLGQGHERQGVFVEWHFDGRRFVARNDRYGFYPCYYFQRDGEVCLSPSIFRLIAEGAPTEIDYPGLAVFFYLGYFVGEDTPFARIRALPPGAVLKWEAGRTTLSERIAYPRPNRLSRSEAVDAYLDLFAQAMERRLPSTEAVALPLSGGKDSRHILLELCRLQHKPRFCISLRYYPPQPNEDARLAALVARALDVPHVVLDQTEPYFHADRRKNVLTNLCSDEHQWVLRMSDYLRGRAEVIYDGVGGDILAHCGDIPDWRLECLQRGDFIGLTANWYQFWRIGSTMDTALCCLLGEREGRKLGSQVAIPRLADEIKRHAAAPNPVYATRFLSITRREMALAPFAILDHVPTVYAPYLDHDLVEMLRSIPCDMRYGGKFHEEVVRRGYPERAAIPFLPLGVPHQSARKQDIRYARDLARYYLKRRPAHLLRNGYLLPRMLACLASRRYAASTYWYAPVCLYLLQLDRAGRGLPADG